MSTGIPRFSVNPNPVQAGGTVTIKGPANGTVYVLNGGNSSTVQLDACGSASVREPVGAGKTFVISDFHPKGAFEVQVQVVESLK